MKQWSLPKRHLTNQLRSLTSFYISVIRNSKADCTFFIAIVEYLQTHANEVWEWGGGASVEG